MYGELKNVLSSSVQKTHLPVRGQKIPRYMWGGIGRRMKICETSYTPIPIVPRLHQRNGDIKGKLRVWRAQKCIALVGAENTLTSAGPKNTPLHGGGIGVMMEKCEISCTPIPMAPRFHQSNGFIKGKQRVWTANKCIALVGAENRLTSSGPKNTPLHWGRYKIENGNTLNSGV